METKIPIATSSCLLGNNVRHNGTNCHNKILTQNLAQVFDFKPICPELVAGFGVPRKSIRLQQNQNSNQAVAVTNGKQSFDVTKAIQKACDTIFDHLPDIYGFILKKSSPSCGFESVKRYNEKNNVISRKSDGLFVQHIRQRMPYIPFEHEGRLNDPYLKEHFIKRVFLHYEARHHVLEAESINDLMHFHARHKMLLKLHHPPNQKQLGQILAQHNLENFAAVKQHYHDLFLQSFMKVAKPGHHVTILQRLLRQINRKISQKQRVDFETKIKLFYERKLPLAVPVEMIKHHLLRHDIAYLKRQSYLNLYPECLALKSMM